MEKINLFESIKNFTSNKLQKLKAKKTQQIEAATPIIDEDEALVRYISDIILSTMGNTQSLDTGDTQTEFRVKDVIRKLAFAQEKILEQTIIDLKGSISNMIENSDELFREFTTLKQELESMGFSVTQTHKKDKETWVKPEHGSMGMPTYDNIERETVLNGLDLSFLPFSKDRDMFAIRLQEHIRKYPNAKAKLEAATEKLYAFMRLPKHLQTIRHKKKEELLKDVEAAKKIIDDRQKFTNDALTYNNLSPEEKEKFIRFSTVIKALDKQHDEIITKRNKYIFLEQHRDATDPKQEGALDYIQHRTYTLAINSLNDEERTRLNMYHGYILDLLKSSPKDRLDEIIANRNTVDDKNTRRLINHVFGRQMFLELSNNTEVRKKLFGNMELKNPEM